MNLDDSNNNKTEHKQDFTNLGWQGDQKMCSITRLKWNRSRMNNTCNDVNINDKQYGDR